MLCFFPVLTFLHLCLQERYQGKQVSRKDLFQFVEKQSGNEIKLVPDPLVRDDQAIVVNVRNNGLVILTGYSHAGIINTIDFAK
jgi:metal-dependent hydrolase (beta-lactamase superfamily II)